MGALNIIKKVRISKTKLKKDLLEQLAKRNLTQAHYIDLANDYISLWEVKNLLLKDIEERGVKVPWQSSFKKNDSIAELSKISAQMLKVLADLGIKGADVEQTALYDKL